MTDMDWQKKLSDEFDVDGYTLSQASAKDFYGKFRKAELRGRANGMREADEICERQIKYYESRMEKAKAAAPLGSEQFERFYNYKDCTEFIRSEISAKLQSSTD